MHLDKPTKFNISWWFKFHQKIKYKRICSRFFYLFNYVYYNYEHASAINDTDWFNYFSFPRFNTLSTFAKLNRTALINRDNLGITDVKLADRNLYLLQIKLTDVHRNPWNPRSKVVCKLRFDWRKPENEQGIASPKMSTIFWSFEHVRATFERSGSRLISEFS